MRKLIQSGALAGIAGGLIFGVLMAMMGMLKMIAGIVGSSSAIVGFVIHLLISAFIGVVFALLFDRFATGPAKATVVGVLYGFLWWILGPLTLMPAMMGMGVTSQWNIGAISATMPSLMGHVIYGAVLGFTYARLRGAAVAAIPKPAASLR